MACSAHVEKGDIVAVSAATEQCGPVGSWNLGITRGTVLQGTSAGKNACLLLFFKHEISYFNTLLI